MSKTDTRVLRTPGGLTSDTNNHVGILYKCLTAEEFEALRDFIALMKRLSSWAQSMEGW